ncbi:hypothetical protein KC678_04290 [Candidatus Dojkabacteria bacterium]|uniref:Uncharacterized protein n=1 Tax=Candidatus Dojkabacteria bacterium TaxID=2099670 RepID=A0A955L223_9BACT|nr:hypothetical protein [Candidatus Dojkabacteria bacterium]
MILSLQTLLENINIFHVLFISFLYLIILWSLIPIWVYIDAKKRYDNPRMAKLFFFLILPLNIPGFIIYIIIRPDDQIDFPNSQIESEDLINVPIVKFLNEKNDFVMSFDLRINGGIIDPKDRADLNMQVSIDADKKNIVLENTEDKPRVVDKKSSEAEDQESIKEKKLSKKEQKQNRQKKKNKQKKNKTKSKFRESIKNTLKEVKGFFILEDEE